MVSESWEWKKELREKQRQLIRYNTKENFDQNFGDACFKVKRDLLYSAFIIRTLIESEKLSDDADTYTMNVSCIMPIEHIDRLHRWMDEEEYDWNNIEIKSAFGKNICNWLIHSYVFSFLFEEGAIIGFFVSSDYDRNKELYSVAFGDWLKYLDFIISDDVVEISMRFNDKKSDYIAECKKRGSRRTQRP